MTERITMIELFSGIGAQERALRQLKIPYEVINTCDCDKDAVLSYAAMRNDFENELNSYDFPSAEDMISELQGKNVGYDFMKGKHTITTRTSIDKLKQYYLADKLSHNLGDISKVARLSYADMVTYSFPCTDLSVAGKGEGMQNKCESCGHSWPIDFSNSEEVLTCPNCGKKVSSSTRSGLLGQVQRLLSVASENNELPKYLLLENVKNLVGKKFVYQFDAWVKWLDSIGYNTYYRVLNAKHYGISQNRERIFAISVRKDVDDCEFKFPEKITLTTRLKDILEKNVDEKYYLPDDRIDKILNSTFMQEKKRIQMKDVCDTLLARDWKDPKCVQVEDDASPIRIGNIYDEKFGTGYAGNVWDKDGISPTLQTAQGGNRQPLVIDEIKVVGNYMPSNHDASRVVDIDGIAPTVKENHGTVTAIVEPFIVASRGRNPENPSDRTAGAYLEQRLEPNFSGCTNTITSVQKDNYVATPIVYDDYNSRISSDQDAINTLTTNCGASAERNGVKIIEPIVCEERRDEGIRLFKDDCVGTLRTIDACGDKRVIEPEPQLEFVGGAGGYSGLYAVGEPEIIKEDVIFPVVVRKYDVDVENLKKLLREHKNYSNKEIAEKLNVPLTQAEHWFRQDEYFAIPDADIWFEIKNLLNITTDEFDESITTFEVKDGVYDKANRCYHINGIAPTLTVASGNEKIFEPNNIKWRIRKLTPKECWRLMGFTDEDHDRASKYVSASSLYKQAGNSICTCCLVAIFNALFLKDYSTSYADKLVNYNS